MDGEQALKLLNQLHRQMQAVQSTYVQLSKLLTKEVFDQQKHANKD